MAHLIMSRSEINLVRLIAQCEEMIAVGNRSDDWRIKKYIEKLEELLFVSSNSARKPDNDKLKEYQKKIGFLKDFVASEHLPSAVDKAMANRLLSPANTQTIPSVVTSPTGKQIKQAATSKYNKQMKAELFAKEKKSNDDDSVRYRNSATTPDDIEKIMRIQQEQQDRIADDIISLTRNLKHNITVSGKIIKEDTAVLKSASQKADDNVNRLKNESARLEAHLQKGTNWWQWIAIGIVCVTFLFMIFFIRFFPKPR